MPHITAASSGDDLGLSESDRNLYILLTAELARMAQVAQADAPPPVAAASSAISPIAELARLNTLPPVAAASSAMSPAAELARMNTPPPVIAASSAGLLSGIGDSQRNATASAPDTAPAASAGAVGGQHRPILPRGMNKRQAQAVERRYRHMRDNGFPPTHPELVAARNILEGIRRRLQQANQRDGGLLRR
ncbi:hypothetical protein LTR65_007475 [Meristemomyces frigidus]